MDIRNVKSSEDLVRYFIQNLNWNIDEDDFDEIDDISFDFDDNGNAVMVDVSGKDITARVAEAVGTIAVSEEVFRAVTEKTVKKGDVLTRILSENGRVENPDEEGF